MTGLQHIDTIRSLPSKSWLMACVPTNVQSTSDWQRREVPMGTKARINFVGGGIWCHLESGEKVVIEEKDLLDWEVSQPASA